MANRYWVGNGAATWITAGAGSGWATTSGGAAGQTVPLATDDVFVDAVSPALGIGNAAVCQSLDFTGYTNTWTLNSNVTLSIGSSAAGPGNVVFKMATGMTVNNIGIVAYVGTNATPQTYTSNGKNSSHITVNTATGTLQFADAVNTSVVGGAVTITAGTLDTNSQTCSWASFVGTSVSTKTLTLGSSAITVTGNWALHSSSTVTSNTATVTQTGVSASFDNNAVAGLNYNGMSLIQSGSGTTIVGGGSSAITLANFTRTSTAVKTDAVSIGTSGGLVVSASLILTGQSTTNRLFVGSTAMGTTRTITAASVTVTNVDWQDITGAGVASPFTGTSMGDALGNTNITMNTPTARYAVVAGNWSNTATWSTTSGGAGGASVPLPQDNIIMNGSSAAGIYTIDMPRGGKDLTCTGFTQTVRPNASTVTIFYGDLVLGAAGIYTNATSGSWTFSGRGSRTITSNGSAFSNASSTGSVNITTTGTYTLADNFTISAGTLSVVQGTFDTAGFTISTQGFTSTGTLTRIVNLRASTINISLFWTISGSGITLNAGTSVIVISAVSTSARTFAGGGFTYGTLTYTLAGSSGSVDITGANTFNTLNVGSGRAIRFTAATTTTVTNWNVNGTDFGYQYLPGVANNYISTPDSVPLSITGDITVLTRIAADSYTGTALLAAKLQVVATQWSWELYYTGGNTLNWAISPNGTSGSIVTATSTATFAPGNGNPIWLLVSWRASDGRTQFFTASGAIANPVASDFTQLGADRTANIGAIFDSTSIVELGSNVGGTGNLWAGKYYRAMIYNGVFSTAAFGGTLQFDANLADKTVGASTFTESSSNAATVTVSGALALVGDGRVELSSITAASHTLAMPTGISCDYLYISRSTLTGNSAYAGVNSTDGGNNSTAPGWIFTAPPANAGFFLFA